MPVSTGASFPMAGSLAWPTLSEVGSGVPLTLTLPVVSLAERVEELAAKAEGGANPNTVAPKTEANSNRATGERTKK